MMWKHSLRFGPCLIVAEYSFPFLRKKTCAKNGTPYTRLLWFLHRHVVAVLCLFGHELRGHGVAAVAGSTGHGFVFRFGVGIVDLGHVPGVNVLDHGNHGAGDLLVLFGIRGEVGLVRLLVDLMTKITMNAECA